MEKEVKRKNDSYHREEGVTATPSRKKRLHLQKEVHGMNGVPQSYFAQAFAVRRGSRSLVVAVERTDQVERKQNLQETNMC